MNSKTKDRWNKLAAFWDDDYQEGDFFHRAFLFPTLLNWTGAKKRMKILDIGCGNGALARLFAKAGARVIAVDLSEIFIAKAKARSQGLAIDYRVIDGTLSKQLATLVKDGPFDRIVSSMVLHNMPTIIPLATYLPRLLKKKGAFIFTTPHPCFNSGLIEIEKLMKHAKQQQLILPNRYIHSETVEIFSKPDQPVKQFCFHRSLSEIFNPFFDAGLIMTGFIEPVAKRGELPKNFLWAKLLNIPPALISRWEIKK